MGYGSISKYRHISAVTEANVKITQELADKINRDVKFNPALEITPQMIKEIYQEVPNPLYTDSRLTCLFGGDEYEESTIETEVKEWISAYLDCLEEEIIKEDCWDYNIEYLG